jgi:hypothetical protein
MMLGLAGLLAPGSVRASGGSPLGYLTSFDGKDVIFDGEIANQIDIHFEDGSPGDGTVDSNVVAVFTQCFAGNFAFNFDHVAGDSDEGGPAWDPVAFSNAGVVAGSAINKSSKYGLFHDDAARALRPGRRVVDVLKLGRRGFLTQQVETPFELGSTSKPIGGASSTHVLVYMSHPNALDDADIAAITSAFPEGPTQTVTVLAGDGTGTSVDGAATRANLFSAIETIGDLMDDGPDEQFILFIGDHGGVYHSLLTPVALPGATVTPPEIGQLNAILDVPRDVLATLIQPILDDPNAVPEMKILLHLLQAQGVDPNSIAVQGSFTLGPPALLCPSVPGPNTYVRPDGSAFDAYACESEPGEIEPLDAFLIKPEPLTLEFGILNEDPNDYLLEGVHGSLGPLPRPPKPDHQKARLATNPDFCQCGEFDDPNRDPLDCMSWGTDKRSDPNDGAFNFQGVPGSTLDANGPRPPLFPGLPSNNRAIHCNPIDDTEIRFLDRGDGTGALTVMGFVNLDTHTAGRMVGRGDTTQNGASWSLGTNSNGHGIFQISPSGYFGFTGTTIQTPDPIPTGQWHHVAATFDPQASEIEIFFDGRRVAEQSFAVPGSRFETSDPLTICSGLDGQLDELTVYHRGLTAEDIAEVYQSSRGFGASVFRGFDVTPLGSNVEIGHDFDGGLSARGAGPSGSDAVSFNVLPSSAETDGFELVFDTSLHDVAGGTAVGAFSGVKIGASSLGGGLVLAQYDGVSNLYVGDFSALGSTSVDVEILKDANSVATYAELAGLVGFSPGIVEPVGIELLSPAGTWGYSMTLSDNVDITPTSGGGPFNGNQIQVTVPGYVPGTITEVSNVDILSIDTDVKLFDIGAAPLPDPIPGDVNGDGCVNAGDLAGIAANFGKTGVEADPYDLNGDGVVNVIDLRLVVNEFGNGCPMPISGFGASASASASASGSGPSGPVDFGGGGIALSLSPSNTTLLIGESVSLDIDVTGLVALGAPTLAGLVFEIHYDPNVFALTGASFGSDLGAPDTDFGHAVDPNAGMSGLVFDAAGIVHLYALSLLDGLTLDASQPTSVLTATLSFEAIAAGSASFDPNSVEMVDPNGVPLAAASSGAAITVNAPAIPTLGWLGIALFAAVGAGVLARARRRRGARPSS